VKRAAPKNLSASVSQRLLNHSREKGEDFQYTLTRYGLERLLYRLSKSEHAGEFVLKGAMLFLVWAGETYRPTKDVDLLAVKAASVGQFRKIFRDLCSLTVVEDGLVFQPDSVQAEEIREEEAYHGVRVTLRAELGRARIPLQVDIGFGDAVTPKPTQAKFPTLLDFPAPQMSMYPKETVVAEKFETMVRRGIASSRMRDYYDVYALSQEFEFDGETLAQAIRATCKRRRTALPTAVPLALTAEFSGDTVKRRQWEAFLKRGRLKLKVTDLGAVVRVIREFLMPAVETTGKRQTFKAHWPKGGPWKQNP